MNVWDILATVTDQVNNYSSFLGQLWYILVFGFRLFVISSLAGSVYGDEQSMFRCSTNEVGCASMCFNTFSKISHPRFWAFQLIATVTPTVFFHLYILHVQGQIQKIKEAEKQLNPKMEREHQEMKIEAKMTKRQNKLGKYKIKKVYNGTDSKEVPESVRIKIAFLISLLVRLFVEVLFIYFSLQLFNIDENPNPMLAFLWMRVPASYTCHSHGAGGVELDIACGQHFLEHNIGYVPCWVSRPYEKTVFVRFINILTFLCTCLTAMEILLFISRQTNHMLKSKSISAQHSRTAFDQNRIDAGKEYYVYPNPAPVSRKEKGKLNKEDERMYPSLKGTTKDDFLPETMRIYPILERGKRPSSCDSLSTSPPYEMIQISRSDWKETARINADNSSRASSRRHR